MQYNFLKFIYKVQIIITSLQPFFETVPAWVSLCKNGITCHWANAGHKFNKYHVSTVN